MTSADVYRTELGRVSEFQSTLLETTPLMFLGRALGVFHETPGVAHARQVLYTLDRLPKPAGWPARLRLCAHRRPPPPLHVSRRRVDKARRRFQRLRRRRDRVRHSQTYRQEYREQAIFVSHRILQVIGQILVQAPPYRHRLALRPWPRFHPRL